ncbi:MAG TPA: hypothetical protein VGG50_11410, partial [Streptosporangiaceae bacterium]
MKDDGRIDRAGAWYQRKAEKPEIYDAEKNRDARKWYQRNRKKARRERNEINRSAREYDMFNGRNPYEYYRDLFVVFGHDEDFRH